jgi:hypothetical protein
MPSASKRKLTRAEWDELDIQYSNTPGLTDVFSASGEHYLLIAVLNRLGYFPHSREEALEMTEELLSNGYE